LRIFCKGKASRQIRKSICAKENILLIREELNARGWVENTEFEEDVVPKAAFHLLYAVKSKAAFEMELSDNQLINHFEGAKALTTKVGLVHSIKSLSRS